MSSLKRAHDEQEEEEEGAPLQKRLRSEEEQEPRGDDVEKTEALFNFLVAPGGLKARRLAFCKFLPFWYNCATVDYICEEKVWIPFSDNTLVRTGLVDGHTLLCGFNRKKWAYLFQNPRGVQFPPLRARFRIDYGVPTTVTTPFFPPLLPLGGEEHMRDAMMLHKTCFEYLRKAITRYSLPKCGHDPVFVKATGWRSNSDGTRRYVSGKDSHTMIISIGEDVETGKIRLCCICMDFHLSKYVSIRDVFTPAVQYNIGLVLETFSILGQIPRNLRLLSRRFAPQLDLVAKFEKDD
jgi:hypothetical protein